MSWREHLQNLSHSQVTEIASLCTGAALFVAIAVVLSGTVPFLPAQVKVAVQTVNQTAAAANAAAAPYWNTQPYYNGPGAPNGFPAYTAVPSLGYYPFPSPIACHFNHQSVFYYPNCILGFPAGILSAFVSGTSNGTYTYGKFGTSPSRPCNPGPYLSGFAGAGTAQPLIVAPGAQVQLDWACQPVQYASVYLACGDGWRYLASNIYTSAYVTNSSGNTYPSATWGAVVSQTAAYLPTITANTANLIGSTTVTVVGTQGTVINYKLYCSAGGVNTLNATVPVIIGPLVAPTVSITGNGQTGTVTADVGTTTVAVVATFVPGSGDTVTRTALNGCTTPNKANPDQNCQNALPGVSNIDAATPKTYAFKPTQPGFYYFYPAVQTQFYFTGWNDYGKKLVVDARCAAGTHWVAGSGGNGFAVSDPSKLNGQCVANSGPPTCPGAHQINPPTCSCDNLGGYSGPNGGPCTPTPCADQNTNGPPSCTCKQGFVGPNGGPCTPAPPIISLHAAPARVQSGYTSTITWSVTGITANAGVICSITSNPAGVFSQSMPANTAPAWSGSAATGAIGGTTVVTLSCTGAVSKSITVGLIPNIIEI